MGTRTKRKAIRNPRIELWAHCVSEHAAILDLKATMEELADFHDHEHRGPGTIRDHDKSSRKFTLKTLGQVLSEDDS